MSRILAADDNKLLRVFYEDVLSYLGQEYEICKNGQEALDAFKRQAADLVILDVDMPVMNGFDCCRAIRNTPEGVSVPIVIVSSHDDENHIAMGLDAGANDYLIKPVKETHLIAKLKNFLKNSSFLKGECDLIKGHATISGKYRVEKMIGSGAHSTVFQVTDIQSNKTLALKMLKESASSNDISKPFFETAAKIRELQSDYIVKILDMGQFSERLYIVMEFIDGGDLSELLKRKKILSEHETAKMAEDIALALKTFHSAGLIHLDLKPENILIDSATGKYKLADFGLITVRSTTTMPLNAEIWSTLAYVAPEYFSEEGVVSGASDIYSLGVTMYQCISGDNPFLSERPAITMSRHMNLIPPLLKSSNSIVSSGISCIVADMLNKPMELRPNAEEAARKIEEIINNPEIVTKSMDNVKALSSKAREISGQMPVEEVKAQIRKERRIRAKFETSQQWKSIASAGLATIFIALIFMLLGYGLNTIFFEQKQPAQGALITTNCSKCGTIDRLRIADITKSKCGKCGSTLGYAMKCESCNKIFPYILPPLNNLKDKNAIMAKLEEARKCPACGSTKVALLPNTEKKKAGKKNLVK
ncbi:MAG: hypothetical protein A2017_12895 [Lentisphaerae bacterium GWF2_44_16]|nr:MAG: hypothetical protein A2017_12895 [Lentisphaerae bacterium GWF2_44_16]